MSRVGRTLSLIVLGVLILALIRPTEVDHRPTTASCPELSAPVFVRVDAQTAASLLTTAPAELTASQLHGFPVDLGARFAVSDTHGPRLVPVHELQNPTTGDLRYLWAADAIRDARATGYRDDGVRFYAEFTQSPCAQGIAEFTRGGVSRYAMTAGDRSRLSAAGWRDRGNAFFARPLSTTSWPAVHGKDPLDNPPYLSRSTKAWTAYQQAGSREERDLLYQIAATPTAIWLGGSAETQGYVNKITSRAIQRGQTPIFVLYAIPHRDCGGYAAGGLPDPAPYRRWVDQIREGIAGRRAVVIIEPDAIGMDCLTAAERTQRVAMLRYALQSLSEDPDIWAYIHAGSSGLDPAAFASILEQVGIQYARGFAVNVAGTDTTQNEIAYGKALLAQLSAAGVPDKHFVVDTSRNGLGRAMPETLGTAPRWCNPPGRALGTRPTPLTGDPDVDAFLWIKPPGESDGPCHSGDPNGWFNSYALQLSRHGLQAGTIAELPLPRS